MWFCDSETHSFFTSKDGREEFAFLGWGAIVYDGWTADCVSTGEPPIDAQVATTSEFVDNN